MTQTDGQTDKIKKEYKAKFQITLTDQQAEAIKHRSRAKEITRKEFEKGKWITITKIGPFRI